MSIEEKLALLKYSKRELKFLLEEDKYLEVDFIANDLGVQKFEVLGEIEKMLSEKGKQKRRFDKRRKENEQ
mgnify:FL=1